MNSPDLLEILWAVSRGQSGCDGISDAVRTQLVADGLLSLERGRPLLTKRALRMLSESEAELWRAINPGGALAPAPEAAPQSSPTQTLSHECNARRYSIT